MIQVLSEYIWRKVERSDEERSLRLLKQEQVFSLGVIKGDSQSTKLNFIICIPLSRLRREAIKDPLHTRVCTNSITPFLMKHSLHMGRMSALEEEILKQWHEEIPSLMWAIRKTNKYPMDDFRRYISICLDRIVSNAEADILIKKQD